MADDAGALLVRSGLVSSSALDDARSRVESLGGTLLEQLVVTGAVTDDALTDYFKKRLLVPQVNPNSLARLPAKVVASIPANMAIELRAIPVSVDADNNLTIAMSDPSDRHAVDEIANYTGSYVVRAVATQMQIAWCLAHYYGHVTHLGQRLIREHEEAQQQEADAKPATPDARSPRTRGVTGQVKAMRHRGLVPGEAAVDAKGELTSESEEETTPIDIQNAPKPRARSVSGEIRVPSRRAPSIKPPLPDDSAPNIEVPEDIDSGPVISVEPGRDSDPVITVERRDSDPIISVEGAPDTSGPVLTIEADEGNDYEPAIEIQGPGDDPTNPAMLPVPKRKRPAEPDPPELAARAGEVQFATDQPIKKISFEEPRIIISDDLVDPPAPPPEPRGAVLRSASDQAGLASVSGELYSGEIRGRDTPRDILASIFVELGEEEQEQADTGEQAALSPRDEDDDDDAPAMIHDSRVDESGPVLLDRRRTPSGREVPANDDDATRLAIQAAPPAEIQDEPSDVVVLDARKAPKDAGPRHRNTVVGIGAITAATRLRMAEGSGVPTEELDDGPTDARALPDLGDDTRVETHAAPPADYDTSDEHVAAPPAPYSGNVRDTTQVAVVPAPSKVPPGPSGQVRLDSVKQRAPSRHDDDDDDDLGGGVKDKPTMVMSAVELDEVIPERKSDVVPAHLAKRGSSVDRSVDYDPVDEGWGPPGTTIPPPLLGAIPGSDEPRSGVIPIPDVDSAPLMVAPPLPPEAGPNRMRSPSDAGISRALENATARVLELIHTLDHTTERDQVVAVMIAHLAETHHRAGFFAARGGELTLFAITPRVPSMPRASLRLDIPSTLQDVVGTRLPYRGPMHDDISREFLTKTLGACPAGILLVPVSVRERVVGVLFGDNRTKHTFDDQLALAARAAGLAFERILEAKRGER
ncbi:MAG TPA: hypothetical protein VL326_21515 [Kofleriaceae bacterium]|nr:hypothetical protein [Kofleriaceae bacterium]